MNKYVFYILGAIAFMGFISWYRKNKNGAEHLSDKEIIDGMTKQEIIDQLVKSMRGRPNMHELQAKSKEELMKMLIETMRQY